MIKLKFREGLGGTLIDWTPELVVEDVSRISRKVESDNPGEAGLIVYDNNDVTLRYKQGNVVHTAFNKDLTTVDKYVFEQYAVKKNKTEVKLFEGIADFSTINWPDFQHKISFDIVDKITAINLLTSLTKQRVNIGTQWIADRIPTYPYYLFPAEGRDGVYSAFGSQGTAMLITRHGVDHYQFEHTQTCFKKGETIYLHANPGGTGGDYYIITDSWLATPPAEFSSFMDNGILLPTTFFTFEKKEITTQYLSTISYADKRVQHGAFIYLCTNDYYEAGEGFIDIYSTTPTINSTYPLEAFDGLKIIEAIVRLTWFNANIVNKTGNSTFPIPLSYYAQLIDENPFGKHPYDALVMLADTMQCYIYINRSGDLVIQKKDSLLTSGTTRTIPDSVLKSKKIDGSKKYFWDKLVDAVEIQVQSWLKDENGEFLTGSAAIVKDGATRPRNKLTKEVLTSNPALTTLEELNSAAYDMALEYFEFYGKRHEVIQLTLGLTDDILEWELCDNVEIAGKKYFVESIDIDGIEREVELELVSIGVYDYDLSKVNIPLSMSSYTAGESIKNVTSAIYSVINYYAALPLQMIDRRVTLYYEDNLILSPNNKLDTVQSIKTDASPVFANLNLTNVYKINNIDVLTNNTLGSGVINSSLTKVGTITQGVWNAAPITANYISCNTSHFNNVSGVLTAKNITVTSDNGVTGTLFTLGGNVKINTPQDLRTSASPAFTNLTISNTLRTHIFQKDVVKTTNGILYISDSGVISSIDAGNNRVGFAVSKSASFANGTQIWVKEANNSGTIISVKFTIVSQYSTPAGEIIYNVTVNEGSLSSLVIGMTAARISGGLMLMDASSADSPFLDVIDGGTIRVRLGNITGAGDNTISVGYSASEWGIIGKSGSNKVFELGSVNKIAGWNFDNVKLAKGTASLGFSLNTSAVPFITGKGFEVYDAANPKLFIGDKAGSSLDYNLTNANVLTLKGNITSTATITGGILQTATSGERIVISGATKDIKFYNYSGVYASIKSIGGASDANLNIAASFIEYSDVGTNAYAYLLLGGSGGNSSFQLSSSQGIESAGKRVIELGTGVEGGSLSAYLSYGSDGGAQNIQFYMDRIEFPVPLKSNGYSIPKFWGVLGGSPPTGANPGDYYMGTNGTIWFWSGTHWWGEQLTML